MKLHSLFFIFALFLVGCATEGGQDDVQDVVQDSVVIDEPTTDVVVTAPQNPPTKKKPLLGKKDLPTSPDGEVVELQTEEVVEEVVVAPIFFDCEIKKRNRAQARCSEKSLQTYVEESIQFEGEDGVEHYASVKIVIRANGSTGTVSVLGTSDEQFGAAVVKTLKNLNVDGLMWTPAYKGETAISYDYYTEFEIKY